MRKQFFNLITKLAEKDKDIIFLTGDLGYPFLEALQKAVPKQFFNAGCIEQSLIGIAAGLAFAGKKPFVYSTIPFLIMRAYEQVRDDICYNDLNVKLIGVSHSGFLGFTHNITKDEDVDILNHLPNLRIYIPENKQKLKIALTSSGCAYIRI